jgi:hypothetical protein
MQSIAEIEVQLAFEAAKAERAIQRVKARLAERTAPMTAQRKAQISRLVSFIETHTDRFESPRMRTTDFGKYGLRKVTDVQIEDHVACVQALIEREFWDCLKVSRSPLKAELKARLEGGAEIPGCVLRSGDTAVYKVARSLLEAAVERAVDQEG